MTLLYIYICVCMCVLLFQVMVMIQNENNPSFFIKNIISFIENNQTYTSSKFF